MTPQPGPSAAVLSVSGRARSDDGGRGGRAARGAGVEGRAARSSRPPIRRPATTCRGPSGTSWVCFSCSSTSRAGWRSIGALVIPGLAMTLLALLPWLDRGAVPRVARAGGAAVAVHRRARGRRDADAAWRAGQAGVARRRAWNVRELAGAALMASERPVRPVPQTGRAGRADRGRTHRPSGRLARGARGRSGSDRAGRARAAGHEPARHGRDRRGARADAGGSAARAGRRGGAPERRASIARASGCHLIDGVGGTEGPDLSNVGSKYDAGVDRAADQQSRGREARRRDAGVRRPADADEIHAIAAWLAARK